MWYILQAFQEGSRHVGCIPCSDAWRKFLMLHDLFVVFFLATAGFTASGIISNVYALIVKKKKAETGPARIAYLLVMVVAGPTILFNNAAKSWREKSCSVVAFWLAAAISGYWSLAIGMLVVEIALAV